MVSFVEHLSRTRPGSGASSHTTWSRSAPVAPEPSSTPLLYSSSPGEEWTIHRLPPHMPPKALALLTVPRSTDPARYCLLLPSQRATIITLLPAGKQGWEREPRTRRQHSAAPAEKLYEKLLLTPRPALGKTNDLPHQHGGDLFSEVTLSTYRLAFCVFLISAVASFVLSK